MPLFIKAFFKTTILLFAIGSFLNAHIARAQDSMKAELNQVISTISSFSAHNSHEKLYIQTDKPYYLQNDT